MSNAEVNRDLLYLFYFWLATLFSQRLAELTRLSPLLYYLMCGCMLGNIEVNESPVVIVKESHFLISYSEVCITFVFFALGFEENVANFMMGIRLAWGIAFIGAAVPFLCGFFCAQWFFPDISVEAALMGGLAVTATAVSLTMVALKAEGLATSKPAVGIMTSAVLDDIASLALVAICVPIATGEAPPTAQGIAKVAGKAAIFFLCVCVSHRVVFPHDVKTGFLRHIPLVRRYGLKHILEFNNGEEATLAAMIVSFFFALVAIWLGFHPAIGAYMGGLILEERYFDVGEEDELKNTYQHCFNQVEAAAFGWLGPTFFIKLGATIIIDGDILLKVIGYSFLFFVILFIGQFFSAALSARYVPGGFSWHESWMIGFGMLGRAELFFVVLDVCYNEYAIFTKEMFFTFTFTAMLLNLSVPICIALYTPFYLRSKQHNLGRKALGESCDIAVTTPPGHIKEVTVNSASKEAWADDDGRVPAAIEEPAHQGHYRGSQDTAATVFWNTGAGCVEPLSASIAETDVGRMALRKAQRKERAQRRRLYRESTVLSIGQPHRDTEDHGHRGSCDPVLHFGEGEPLPSSRLSGISTSSYVGNLAHGHRRSEEESSFVVVLRPDHDARAWSKASAGVGRDPAETRVSSKHTSSKDTLHTFSSSSSSGGQVQAPEHDNGGANTNGATLAVVSQSRVHGHGAVEHHTRLQSWAEWQEYSEYPT